MTFSVRASEYTPAADLQDPAGTPGTKNCICIAFYKTGECPYGNFCEHAHHFSELQADAKSNFLTNVPFQDIAPHFVGVSPMSKGADISSFTSAGMTPEWFSSTSASGNEAQLFRGVSPQIKGVVPSFTTNSAAFFPQDFAAEAPAANSHSLLGLHPGVTVKSSGHPFSTTSTTRWRDTGDAAFPAKAADASSTSSSTHSSRFVSSGSGAGAGGRPATEKPRRQATSLPPDCQYPHRCFTGTYYDVLGLPVGAPRQDILAQYRHWHREGFRRLRDEDPEHAEKQDCLIVEARNVLGNESIRREYDALLREAGLLG